MAELSPIEMRYDAHTNTLNNHTDGHHELPSHDARLAYEYSEPNATGSRSHQPETARGAPISYRGITANPSSGLTRSFSQRAQGKSMPFAREVFGDNELAENGDIVIPRQVSNSRTASSGRNEPSGNGDVPRTTRSKQRNIALDEPRNGDQNMLSTAPFHRLSTSSSQAPENVPQTPERAPASFRPAKLRDAANQTDEQRQEWASDRSPLQKLEVKLTDISKEEKRARVQDAEMRLIQKQAQDQASKQGRQESQVVSGNRGETRAVSQRQPSLRATEGQTSQSNSRAISASQAERSLQSASPEPGRSVSSRQPGSDKAYNAIKNANVPRSISLQQPTSRVQAQKVDRSTSQPHKSASRSATSDRLTEGTDREISRSTLQKTQTSMPQSQASQRGMKSPRQDELPMAIDLSTMAGGDHRIAFPQQATAREVQVRQPQAQRERQVQSQPQQTSVGFDSSLPSPRDARDENSPPNAYNDPTKQRQRKSSVSFKEPFDRRRPVDEWRQAETAQLASHDFDLTPNAMPDDTGKAWWEQNPKARRTSQNKSTATKQNHSIDDRTAQFTPQLYVKCGPLLRYTGLKRTTVEAGNKTTGQEIWRGSVMIVTQDEKCSYDAIPVLRLFSQPKKLLPPPPAHVVAEQLAPEYIDPIAGLIKLGRTGKAKYVRPIDHLEEEKDLSRIEDDNGIYEASPSPLDVDGSKNATTAITNKRTSDTDGEKCGKFKEVRGTRIYADPERDVTFWRFNIEIELGTEQRHIAYRINKGASVGFWVPAKGQTMNMMFHSCNGFSLSVDTDSFSGPDPLWRDVLNTHQTQPFHVMIGGGDQIYNDRVMTETQHFAEWTTIRNPHHKHQAPFTSEMKEELETFYLERYCMWFSQGLFAMANASIPMVNIWDDHDIIDGFGSYPHDFMKTPVFSGLGNVAYKYYMLFQHQSIDAMVEKDEPSWLLGHSPGPYINVRSRSVYLELGQSVGFLGIDCRTERTKNDVLSIDTLEVILDRCRREMVEGRTRHLIVLLGVPIAYPRLVWLENVLTSRAMDPIKALGRAGVLKTGFLNKFDGGVELLDDLDDHWTASHHKDERNILIQELQDLAAEKSARVTILGGDVHLGAIGQFYSNPKLKIPKDKDHRYMPNIISSAIVNTPPPELLADVLNKRNKVHHLDKYTDENMIPMFTHDVNMKKRNNNHLLPRRNWCSIREYRPGETPPPSPPSTPSMSDEREMSQIDLEQGGRPEPPKRRLSLTKSDLNPRNLMRRLSSRNHPPPSAYRTDDNTQLRSNSFEGTRPSQQQPPQSQRLAASLDNVNDSENFRPTFHRRPTNLSEKAAKKGNVLAVDEDGNEFDINDHVNLEGGLDIVLNCEVDQKDPAGITVPYRLLVPALWYDGSSDREKIAENTGVSRRETVLRKFGLGSKRLPSTADRQGAGTWDKDATENDGYSDSEGEQVEKPHRTFSFFKSKRKKADPQYDDDYHYVNQSAAQPPQRADIEPPSADVPNSTNAPNYPNKAVWHAPSYSSSSISEDDTAHDFQKPIQSRQQQTPMSTVRQTEQRALATMPIASVMPPSNMQSRQPQNQPQQLNQQRSYTIGGSSSSTSPISPPPPPKENGYDANAAYLEAQRKQQDRYARIMQSSTSSPLQSHPQSQSQSQSQTGPAQPPTRQPSKQERILGIGSAADTGFNASSRPPQTQLRGNGILGRNVSSASSNNNNAEHAAPPFAYNDSIPAGGYDGIEAYREPKSKRRWSLNLKDRAKGLIEGIKRDGGNGNGRYNNGGGDRGYGDEEWYSDEEYDDEYDEYEDEGYGRDGQDGAGRDHGHGRNHGYEAGQSQGQNQQYREHPQRQAYVQPVRGQARHY